MDDLTVIERVQAGEVEAYALLVERYHRRLLAFIFRLVRDRHLTEDIGQEVFLKVYQALPRFNPSRGTPFVAWLYIVARNEAIGALRQSRRRNCRPVEAFDDLAAAGESAEATLIRQEEERALAATLDDLPEPFRTPLLLSLQGASLDDIARRCGVPAATAKTRLFRARKKLELLWKAQFGGAHEY
jgi:RNA polymerase sigma-70 factor (ECF subfamily)